MEKKKILVIDDDPDFTNTTKLILEDAGFEVTEAFSGKEGMERSLAGPPDLYIIDLMMETYSEGADLLGKLNADEITAAIPKIMITAVDLKGPWDSYQQDRKYQCAFILQKPVSPEELVNYVKKSLV